MPRLVFPGHIRQQGHPNGLPKPSAAGVGCGLSPGDCCVAHRAEAPHPLVLVRGMYPFQREGRKFNPSGYLVSHIA